MKEVTIAGRPIGPGHPCFIVAEMSANHGGSLEHAKRVVRAAKECGADAIKLQTYTADTLTLKSNEEPFQIRHSKLWEGRTLHDLYEEASTPWEWQPELKRLADELGILLFSTPFDATAVDFLERMEAPCWKIASLEIVDLPLIERVARTGKPIIISTGIASLDEIDDAVNTARAAGNQQLVLLKCTSAYPAEPAWMNLRTIPDLAARFGVPSGLSDHTMGNAVAIAAVAMGASVIEKHFCLSRAEGGPDSSFSMEPAELRALVDDVRRVEAALGTIRYEAVGDEKANRAYRRSLFAVEDIAAGELLTEKNVRSIRPGHGLPPKHLREILGRRATRRIARGTPLAWDLVGK